MKYKNNFFKKKNKIILPKYGLCPYFRILEIKQNKAIIEVNLIYL